MEEPPHLEPPIRVIGRYALYGKLASGGMATVHFGRLLGPAGFSRTVAIKRLHPQFSKDPEFVAMFLDEARLAARIQHPNVVATVDVVAQTDELFLVMDYVRGESFSRLLRASRKKGIEVTVGTIASVVAGMLHGLHAAHEAKDEHGQPLSVVHRDVSPQNVLVGVDGVTRVLDFGVAKAAARVQVTRDGQMKGKLAYMAPEQLSGKPVDRRSDVFAAGIVLWEAITGRRLFDAEDATELLRMILTEEIPPPSAVIPSVARSLDAIVMRALSRDPLTRYQTARDFAIAVEDAMPLGSTREVGEWVERVAGETLLNREQAVAEIEAISSVSHVSLVTESSPAIMKTLDGRGSPSLSDLARRWGAGPPRIVEPSSGDVGGAPRRGSLPPALPSRPLSRRSGPPPVPRRGEKKKEPPQRIPEPATPQRIEEDATRVFTGSPSGVPVPLEEAEDATRIFTSSPSGAPVALEDAEDPATRVFGGAFDAEDEATRVFDAAGDATHVYGPPSDAPRPERTRPSNRRPPPPRPNSSLDRPALSAESVIIQEPTDPALFPHRRSAPERVAAWFWEDPSRRTFRVALAAGVFALFAGFAFSGHGSRRRAVARAPFPAAVSPPKATANPVAVVASAEEPRGVDPSTLPVEPPEVPEPVAKVRPAVPSPPPAVAAPLPKAVPTPGTESHSTTRVVEAIPRPTHLAAVAPTAQTTEPPKPRPEAAVATTTPSAPSAEVREAPTPAKSAVDCRQPYALDEHGIRRIKPECL